MANKKKAELIKEAVDAGHRESMVIKLKKAEIEQLLIDRPDGQEPIEKPEENTPEWSPYIFSLFEDSELIEEMPTCDGLRRVFKLVIGEIVSVDMDVIKAPTLQDPSATVKCLIRYTDSLNRMMKSISDVFDVNSENTPWPYCKASVATAATKAEARVLRKGLGLNKIYSSEEMHQGFETSEQVTSLSINNDGNKLASDSAKIAITTLSNKLNIDFDKLFKFMGLEDVSIQTLTYEESHQVIALLNEFSRGKSNGGQEVPEELRSEVIF
jgi:hypothetical protein